jgi:hypothetical protein
MRTGVWLGILVAVGLLLAGACFSPESTVCENGNVCPANWRCVTTAAIANKDAAANIDREAGDAGAAADEEGGTVCVPRPCGDGVLNPEDGEQCDDGTETKTCNVNCRVARCGDNYINRIAGEECDPGIAGPLETRECNIDCTKRACGDFKINRAYGEECDEWTTPEHVDTPTCNYNCKVPRCGDDYVNRADVGDGGGLEECDPGDAGETDACNADCTKARCGDRIVNAAAGEECDEGEHDTERCNYDLGTGPHACRFARCHDGYRNGARGEDCDEGADTARCVECVSTTCGDGIIQSSPADEECDPGDAGIGDAGDSRHCNGPAAAAVMCHFSVCGDGYPNHAAGEDCDKGEGGVATPTCDCNIDCTWWRCGDGKRNAAANEECDDGPNPDGGDGGWQTALCEANCTVPRCGDGVINGHISEKCDDGNNDDCGSCSAGCRGLVADAVARGTITPVPASDLLDGGRFVLDDGVAAVTFVFRRWCEDGGASCTGSIIDAGVSSREVAVCLCEGQGVVEVGNEIGKAIGDAGLGISVDTVVQTTGRVQLHGGSGNRRIVAAGDPGFFATGMWGGRPYGCDAGVGCKVNSDCASEACGEGTCR